MNRFVMADPISAKVVDALAAHHPITQILLNNRGVETTEAAATHLAPDYQTGLHSPWLLPNIEAAVERILSAIKADEKIAVYSDYDCDGIPGGVIMHDFLKAIGHTNFFNYIPHRHYEGFGLNSAAIERIAADKGALIITIDCGTSDIEAVNKARERGVDVIITDHHEPGEELPKAVAVVNPKIGTSYPYPELCGSGVIFKLVQALLERGEFSITPGMEKWWLDMVGVATIADMVPLTGENRVLASYGLQVLRKSRRPGLRQLFADNKLSQPYLTEDDIGFTLAPRINAASRMDNPEDAFLLLTSSEPDDAKARASHLEKLNQERKGQVAAMTRELHTRMKELPELPPVLVFGNPSWRPALAGLVANKLAEEYRRPAFVWGRDGNGIIKGSCRSSNTMSVYALMNAVSDIWLEYGGHHQSGGFSVADELIHDVSVRLCDACAALPTEALLPPPQRIDTTLSLSQINDDLFIQLKRLAPFGAANPKPLFLFADVRVARVSIFGKAKDHTKLTLEGDDRQYEAIAFFMLPEHFSVTPEIGATVQVIGHLEESYFLGKRERRIRVVDVLSSL